MRKHKYVVGTALLLIALTAGAATLDSLSRGSTPSGAGQPLCSTATTTAAFQSPGACGLAISSNSPTAANTPLCGTGAGASSYGTALSCGLAVSSNAPSAAGTPLCGSGVGAASYTTAAACFAAGFTVPTVTTSTSLVVGATGAAITASYRATFVESGTPVALLANSCTETAVTVANSAVNAECAVGPPVSVPTGLIWGCRVSTAGTVQLKRCNVTTASVTPTASAPWSVRVFNP